jgi:hypothetical protein
VPQGLVVCLVYQTMCNCIMLGMKDAPDRVGSWFLAIIYTGGRAPGAWRLSGAGAGEC